MEIKEAIVILEAIRAGLNKIPCKGRKDKEGKEKTNEAFLIAIKTLKEKENF